MLKERTFIAIKSDAIQRHLIGEVTSRFEKRGLKLVGCKLVVPTEGEVNLLYPDEEWWYKNVGKKTKVGYKKRGKEIKKSEIEIGRWVREKLLAAWVGRPILAMVWQGAHAVELGRKTVGHTDPSLAEPGTIRGDLTVESYELADTLGHAIRNLVHAAGSKEEAEKEIAIWFDEGELVDYPLLTEEILYQDGWGFLNT